MLTAIRTYRAVTLVLALVSAIIVLGLDAYIVAKFGVDLFHYQYGEGPTVTRLGSPVWAQMGLVISSLSIVFLTGLILNTVLRRNGVLTWISVELTFLGVLWALWVVAAAVTVTPSEAPVSSCGIWLPFFYIWPTWEMDGATCHLFRATEAFSIVSWVIVLLYWIVLLSLSVRSHLRGDRNIWRCHAGTTADFFGGCHGRLDGEGGAGSGSDVKDANIFKGGDSIQLKRTSTRSDFESVVEVVERADEDRKVDV